MELGQFSDETKVIKFAAESYAAVGGNPVIFFMETAEWLYSHYKNTGDTVCLKAAKEIVKAYMEMGLLYERARDIFDRILDEDGSKAEEQFPQRLYSQNRIKKKTTQIREVLGYWPKTGNSKYNADWITKDILEKVEKKQLGCFYYGKKEQEISFELLVFEKESYLIDLEKSRIYTFGQ